MNCLRKFSAAVSLFILLFSSCRAEAFDSDKAFSLLEKQCSFGARVPGSNAHEECLAFIISEASKSADTVYTQSFKKTVSYSKDSVTFTNVIAEINPKGSEHIMLFSHYDSRPFSDKEGLPTPGANDGASSTALLLGLLAYFRENPADKRITFVFFDGEDGGRLLHYDEWFIGSTYFAENYSGSIPEKSILLDMIGDRDLKIRKEGYSELANSELNSEIFANAKRLGKKSFEGSVGYFVDDDHLPLNRKGFRCVDIIDMDYKYWHTTDDTPDKCSKESLSDVADVILETIR